MTTQRQKGTDNNQLKGAKTMVAATQLMDIDYNQANAATAEATTMGTLMTMTATTRAMTT